MRILRDNGLTLVLLALFAASILGHALPGWRVDLQDALRHGENGGSLWAYVVSAQFLSSVFENWESEFLSTAVLVLLSIFLRQRESPESKAVAAPHAQTGE